MFGNTFYHSTIRKTVIAFGSLFNNLFITRQLNDEEQKIKIPIMYSGKEKFIQRYKDTLEHPENSITLNTVLPRLAFEVGTFQYDPSRKKISVNKRTIETVTNNVPTYNTLYTEVPYNITFDLFAFVRYMDDGLQIAEQILPYFTPDFTVAIKQEVTEESDEKMNIPFILNSVAIDNSYEGDMGESLSRMIIWNYNFTARINLFGPLNNTNVIKFVEANIFDINEEE